MACKEALIMISENNEKLAAGETTNIQLSVPSAFFSFAIRHP
jgi:hypothetical protein